MRKEPGNKGAGYVVGVDGGGKETVAVLANLKGRILKMGRSGPSNPRNVGIKKASENIALAIKQILKKEEKVFATFVGLPAIQEDYRNKKEEIKKELFVQKIITSIFKGKVKIGSDQISAFRAGTKQKDGVLIIAGTGCVVHGWRGNQEAKASGWGWLSDEGSAFWTGQKALQAILQESDGRGQKTLISKIAFQKFRVKNGENLLTKIYSKNHTEVVPLFSVFCDQAVKKGDKIAKEIFFQAAREIVLGVKTVIKKLNFQNQEFPLVLVGGMFKSRIILDIFKKEIKRFARKVRFIRLEGKPVIGAVRLAIEMIND